MVLHLTLFDNFLSMVILQFFKHGYFDRHKAILINSFTSDAANYVPGAYIDLVQDLLLLKAQYEHSVSQEKARNNIINRITHHGIRKSLVDLCNSPQESIKFIDSIISDLLEKKGIFIVQDNQSNAIFCRKPINTWQLPVGGSEISTDRDTWIIFGLHKGGYFTSKAKFDNKYDKIHKINNKGEPEVYYKYFSRHHNCAGYTKYLLDQSGIGLFHDSESMVLLGVSKPDLVEKFINTVNEKINRLNNYCQGLMSDIPVNTLIYKVDKNREYLKENSIEANLPYSIKKLLHAYKAYSKNVCCMEKLKLLKEMFKTFDRKSTNNIVFINHLQAETRRNYLLPFDLDYTNPALDPLSVSLLMKDIKDLMQSLIPNQQVEHSLDCRNLNSKQKIVRIKYIILSQVFEKIKNLNSDLMYDHNIGALLTKIMEALQNPQVVSGRNSRTKNILLRTYNFGLLSKCRNLKP